MPRFDLVLAAATAAGFAYTLAVLVLGVRRVARLPELAAPLPSELPSLSVVVAARNEERGLERALRTLLVLDGVREVVLVNDRSTDRTAEIADALSRGEPRLRVLHLDALPAGWLGKNHALWRGAAKARGDFLLFTDADVVMERSVARRALGYAAAHGVDHLTIAPRVEMPGVVLRIFGVVFGIFFVLLTRPWRARDPRSPRHIGIGAFNLVRAEAYRRIGTHQAIAMRPDDDLKLGKLVKKHGLRQDFLLGGELIRVEWYASVRELVNGLKKNSFAGLGYSLAAVLVVTLALLIFWVWPFLAIWLIHGWTRALYAFAVALMLVIFAGAAREQGVPAWFGLALPAAVLFFLYIVWNATLYTLRTGGIEWRGTRYSLDELRANRV